jgi:hypothetical protein
MKIEYSWIGIICTAFAACLLSCSRLPWFKPDEKAVAAAQDEVYEAVVHEMITPAQGRTRFKQLVFSHALLSDRSPGTDLEACKQAVGNRERWYSDPPHYDSLADKIYRLVTHGWMSATVQTATADDFLEKKCSPGHLSRMFRTDLPKSFVASENVYFEGWPIRKKGPPSFERLFPGARGIIWFSRVGFNRTLDEALVYVSFVCGGLCGEGWDYVLKKRRGTWQVVGVRVIWVS